MEELIFAYPLAAHGSSRKEGMLLATLLGNKWLEISHREVSNAQSHRLYIAHCKPKWTAFQS